MNKISLYVVELWLVMLLTGCAGQHLSGYARIEPIKEVSVKTGGQLLSEGVTNVTLVDMFLDPGLYTEVIKNGGVWTVLALTDSEVIIEGEAWKKEELDFFGNPIIIGALPASEKELEGAKIIYLNRDAGYAYSVFGHETILVETDENDEKKLYVYDSEEFEESEEYRREFFNRFGFTIVEFEEIMKNDFFKAFGKYPNEKRYQEVDLTIRSGKRYYNSRVAEDLPEYYKYRDGSSLATFLSEEDFRKSAAKINTFSTSSRYFGAMRLPLMALPFSGVGLAYTAGAVVVHDVINASVDDDWKGNTARSVGERYALAPNFRQMSLSYKHLINFRDDLIKEKNQEIKNLQQELLLIKNGG